MLSFESLGGKVLVLGFFAAFSFATLCSELFMCSLKCPLVLKLSLQYIQKNWLPEPSRDSASEKMG